MQILFSHHSKLITFDFFIHNIFTCYNFVTQKSWENAILLYCKAVLKWWLSKLKLKWKLLLQSMFPLIFCAPSAQKFWRVRIFLGIHSELKRFLCPKLGKDQKKKVFTQNGAFFFVRNYVKTKKKRRSSS